MSKNESWQNTLDNFLAENPASTDTRVLARALASNESQDEIVDNASIEALERAIHIEQNLDAIGLQPLPQDLENKLQQINQTEQSNKVIWGRFSKSWKQLSAIAATITIAVVIGSMNSVTPVNQQPTLAEVKQAEQELLLALQYVSIAKTKSANKVTQALDQNVRLTLNQSLIKPLNHVKESL